MNTRLSIKLNWMYSSDKSEKGLVGENTNKFIDIKMLLNYTQDFDSLWLNTELLMKTLYIVRIMRIRIWEKLDIKKY